MDIAAWIEYFGWLLIFLFYKRLQLNQKNKWEFKSESCWIDTKITIFYRTNLIKIKWDSEYQEYCDFGAE